MKLSLLPGLAAATLWLTAGAAHAQFDPLQVRGWAAACANCHGTNGRAQTGNEPLAGQNKDEMMKKLMDFKSGAKPATIMHQLSKGYTDEQLSAIVGWFAAQKK
ncbi:c-type cytochrome [Ottowia testudinis]|uniref:Class I cytochrome c n=1 Tax=Ottowia testudinis TaxID=2816950 RepID=A0A975CI23_9BURK|nr:class I cytochrome c [Ottowia testudinis]QTD46206.1 class I cytochrome c [Ottowia testudinis]